MDEINNIRNQLKKIEEKYPLFVECWTNFLNMREIFFLKSIEKCDDAIKLIKKSNSDLTPESIGLILILINQYNKKHIKI